MSNNEYYNLLDLHKENSPSNNDIKKAYKKAALKWHPDRCRDETKKKTYENKFKKISEAYEVLSDPNKKKLYDQFGKNGLNMGNSNSMNFGGKPGHFNNGRTTFIFRSNTGDSNSNFNMHTFSDPFDLFNDMFSKDRQFSNMGNFSNINPKSEKFKKTVNLNCTLEELYNGANKKIKITLSKTSNKIIDIKIKPGWKAGTKLTYNIDKHIIVFIIKEVPHSFLIRKNNDLYWNCKISQKQASKGVKLTIPKLNNSKPLIINTKGEYIYTNKKKIFENLGMPIKNSGKKGNLIINFIVNTN